jgi:hypothetical protein
MSIKSKTNSKNGKSKPQETNVNDLLVPPEFVEVLQEYAYEPLKLYLENINAPAEMLGLLKSVNDLGYYLIHCLTKPEYFAKDKFDIEGLVLETINTIVKAGGVFPGRYAGSVQRENTPLADVPQKA